MSEPHRIRLPGFWTVTPLLDGREIHTRHFGKPRTIDANEAVWLVCERMPGAAIVSVNEEELGSVEAGQPFAFDITSRLNPRNKVTIEFATPPNEPVGGVAIEIRSI